MSVSDAVVTELSERVTRLERELAALRTVATPALVYTVAEFASQVGRAPYTVREWARQGRIHATRRATGGGPYQPWVIRQEELVRYQQWGLRPAVP